MVIASPRLVLITEGDRQVSYEIHTPSPSQQKELAKFTHDPSRAFVRRGVRYVFYGNIHSEFLESELNKRLQVSGKVRVLQSPYAYASDGTELVGWVAWYCAEEDLPLLKQYVQGFRSKNMIPDNLDELLS